MTDSEILSLYSWTTGSCFRCARQDLDTTRIREIDTPIGVPYDVRACRTCILDLEADQQHRAARAGALYTPGALRQVGT